MLLVCWKQSFYNRKTPICELSFRLGKCIDVELGYFDIHVNIRQMFHETPKAYYGLQTSTKNKYVFHEEVRAAAGSRSLHHQKFVRSR